MAINQSGFFPILFSFAIYGILHSLLASHKAKAVAEKTWEKPLLAGGTGYFSTWLRFSLLSQSFG